jgi:hypothetical protein
MGSPIADASLQGRCAFQGTVTAGSHSAHVTVERQAVLVAGTPPSVAGCTFATNAGPLPCATVTTQQATRVTASAQPVLLATTGWTNTQSHPPAPIQLQPGQQRVRAT